MRLSATSSLNAQLAVAKIGIGFLRLEVKGHNGKWYEIIRYITPYGVPCDGSFIDLTDFMSVLQGKIRFKVNMGSFWEWPFVFT